ncbi:MAG: HAD family hydrolase [Bacteroides sp.]|nr:HAD family hydrolase [Bacteroides sp.]
MIRLVIFDLDGTLLNTVADLAESTNYTLNKLGFPVHPTENYKFFVGNGINKLFERALPQEARTEENIQQVRTLFLPYYASHSHDKSSPYPGIPELLNKLREKDISLAVASNKYHQGTLELIAYYFREFPFIKVLGQREGINPKPDPSIVEEILQESGIKKEETLYVGDSGVDMQTALNAGVTACGVTWGFRPRTELEQFSPAYIVDTPEEILPILSRIQAKS